MEKVLRVTMLGSFSMVDPADEQVREMSLSGRSRRLWTLVAYLILHRDRGVPPQELIELLWEENESDDPIATLQNNVSRAKAALGKLGFADAKSFITYKEGMYHWAVPVQVDYEAFEKKAKAAKPEETDAAMEALSLYTGDFLPDASGELWCVSMHMYLRNLYTKLCVACAKELLLQARYAEAESICYTAFTRNPMEEAFSVHLMRALTLNGKPKQAIETYNYLKKLYKNTYGVEPSPELELERTAAEQELHDRSMTDEDLKKLLSGFHEEKGAFLCDSRTFYYIVNLYARDLERRKTQAQIVLMYLSQAETPEKQAILMKRMEKILMNGLRAGDPFARMGGNQFAILLPSATPENGKMVLDRILSSYEKEVLDRKAHFRCRVIDLAKLKHV